VAQATLGAGARRDKIRLDRVPDGLVGQQPNQRGREDDLLAATFDVARAQEVDRHRGRLFAVLLRVGAPEQTVPGAGGADASSSALDLTVPGSHRRSGELRTDQAGPGLGAVACDDSLLFKHLRITANRGLDGLGGGSRAGLDGQYPVQSILDGPGLQFVKTRFGETSPCKLRGWQSRRLTQIRAGFSGSHGGGSGVLHGGPDGPDLKRSCAGESIDAARLDAHADTCVLCQSGLIHPALLHADAPGALAVVAELHVGASIGFQGVLQ
jgi:hypothetical protein